MLFGRKPASVSIRLIELTSGRAIGKTAMAQSDLPECWETVPTFTFGEEWQLLEAQPMRRDDVIKAGHVDLIVRRPVVAGDGTIYSEPTISGNVASILAGSSKAGVKRYQLVPEDWRQVEFVSVSLQGVIDENLSAIRAILDDAVEEEGYTLRHTRSGLDQPIPIDSKFTLAELLEIFEDGVDMQDGLAFLGVAGLVDGGFAFVSSSLTQYFGYTRDGAVAVLCIGGIGTHEFDSPEIQGLADFAFDKGLTLVEWPAANQMNPDTEDFFQFFDPAGLVDETAPV